MDTLKSLLPREGLAIVDNWAMGIRFAGEYFVHILRCGVWLSALACRIITPVTMKPVDIAWVD